MSEAILCVSPFGEMGRKIVRADCADENNDSDGSGNEELESDGEIQEDEGGEGEARYSGRSSSGNSENELSSKLDESEEQLVFEEGNDKDDEEAYLAIIRRCVYRYRARRLFNRRKERIKKERMNTENSDPWTSRRRGRGPTEVDYAATNRGHGGDWDVIAFAGKYNTRTGEPEGKHCKYLLAASTPNKTSKKRTRHRHRRCQREYRGSVRNGLWSGWGTLSCSSSSGAALLENEDDDNDDEEEEEEEEEEEKFALLASEETDATRVDITGLWEDADPMYGLTQTCFGKMPVNLKRGIRGTFHGSVLDCSPCGHGIIEVAAPTTISKSKSKSNSKSKKKGIVRKVGRFWFGRNSSCKGDHDQMGVTTAAEYYRGSRQRLHRDLDFENLNAKCTLEVVQMARSTVVGNEDDRKVPTKFSNTISDSGDGFLPLAGSTITKSSTFYRGKTFQGTTPCGIGNLVAKRGARPLNPLAHTFEGFWGEGRQHHGTTRWENGDVFVGEHDEHGRPHGSGRMEFGGCLHAAGYRVCPRFCTGPKWYAGDWCKGKLHGVGELAFLDGRRYRGAFRHNTLSGFGTMQYFDGRLVSGDWLGARPLHPATHVVKNATLRDALSTTKVSCAVHGYAHGAGMRVWTKLRPKSIQHQEGTFHWGVFVRPTQMWVGELVLEVCVDDVCEEVAFRAATKASSSSSSGDTDDDGDSEEVAGSSALLSFAQGAVASANATSALLAAAHEDDTSAEATSALLATVQPVGETPGHLELRRRSTSELLSAAHAISDDVVQATSQLLLAASAVNSAAAAPVREDEDDSFGDSSGGSSNEGAAAAPVRGNDDDNKEEDDSIGDTTSSSGSSHESGDGGGGAGLSS